MNQQDLELNILRLLDGELAAGEVAALESKLMEDAAARETYVNLVQLHNILETRFAVSSTVAEMAAVPVKRVIRRKPRHLVKVTLMAIAATIIISAVTIRLSSPPAYPVSIGRSPMPPAPSALTPPAPSALTPPAVHPVPIGIFRTASDSVFTLGYEGDGETPGGEMLAEGSKLHLANGTVEVIWETGVRMIAGAPCDFHILDVDRIALNAGTAWFQVPANAVGFSVETPALTIVDLGTEFGVVAASGGNDEIHVIKGAIDVAGRRQGGKTQTLHVGQARRADPAGGLLEIAAEASKFRTDLKRTLPVVIANHSFEVDVLPRDGDRSTSLTGSDDYDKDFLPSGWAGFDDGDGGVKGSRGILSTARDSHFSESLATTPEADENDQVFYSAARDIYQVLVERLRPNSTYVLTVDIGDRAYEGSMGNPGNPGFRLGVGTIPGQGLLKPTTTRFPTQVDGSWVTWRVTYKTGASPPGLGQPLRIELTSGRQVGWFDNVRLTVTR